MTARLGKARRQGYAAHTANHLAFPKRAARFLRLLAYTIVVWAVVGLMNVALVGMKLWRRFGG
jgi:hypothetical protein